MSDEDDFSDISIDLFDTEDDFISEVPELVGPPLSIESFRSSIASYESIEIARTSDVSQRSSSYSSSSISAYSSEEEFERLQTIFKSTKRAANEVYGKKAAHNGMIYNMSKGYETTEGMRYYWRCETKKCPACIKTNVNYDILAIKEEHNHQKLDPEVLKATIARSEMLASVANSTLTTSEIVDRVRTKVPIAVQAKLPIKIAMNRSVQRERRRVGNIAADPSDLNFVFPAELHQIELRDPRGGNDNVVDTFLLHDTGPGPDRILLFGTRNSTQILRNARRWYCDGTFKIVPRPYAPQGQLLTILARYPGNSKNVLPCIYALLPNKTEATYARCFDQMRSIAFLPSNEVVNAFEALEPILDPQLDDFVLYIENTYIGKRQARRGGRQNPRFLIERWNVHNRTLAGTGRTNNSVEGYHWKLNSFFKITHPSFWIFLDGLKQFHKSIEADYADIRAGKEIHKPRNVWVAVENRKKRIVEAYTPGNYIEFLESMADSLIL